MPLGAWQVAYSDFEVVQLLQQYYLGLGEEGEGSRLDLYQV